MLSNLLSARRASPGRLATWLLPAMAALLTGCASVDGTGPLTPYRMDIVQGNVVTKEQAALLKPGMNRLQVRDILGSPMLADVFHADRWDYVFTIVRPGTAPQQRRVVAHFKGERLDRLEAADLPTEREFVASISRIRPSGNPPPVLELTPEQAQALPRPAPSPAEAPQPMGAVRTYPPLEPS